MAEVGQARLELLKKASQIAQEKGAGRRQAASEKLSSLFSGIREKITKGTDFALGSPDAAAYLGREAVKFSAEKVSAIKNSVVEAGLRTWEGLIDTKDRVAARVGNARDRLVSRATAAKNTTIDKAEELGKRGAIWGLTHAAQPLEEKLQRIYEIPADIKEWQGSRADIQSQKHELRAKLTKGETEEAIKSLKEQIAWLKEGMKAEVEKHELLRDSARSKATELNDKAKTRREQAKIKFSKARGMVAQLQTK